MIGSAGYIAPRHFEAIRAVGGELVAVMDPHDTMGKVDAYFPQAKLFTDSDEFFAFIESENKGDRRIDYLVVCTPNHLHREHVVAGLAAGSAVICEKPLCINEEELASIRQHSEQTRLPVYTIMQLRFHSEVLRLKELVEQALIEHQFDVKLSYFTPRGQWYNASWKSNPSKSGGILMNIGIHLFDLMAWIFGEPIQTNLVENQPRFAEGTLKTNKAKIHWQLGIDLPGVTNNVQANEPIRLLEVDEEVFDLSVYDKNLHTTSYESILMGNGFSIDDASLGLSTLFQVQQSTKQNLLKL